MSWFKIFVDVDGVLSNFKKGLEESGLENPDGSIKWDDIDGNFLANLEPYPGAYDFYDSLKHKFSVFFLTACPMNSSAYTGKATWIENFGRVEKWRLQKLIICPAKLKHFLSGPDRVLIDDTEENLTAWREAGGTAIHCDGSQESYNHTLAMLDRIDQ